MVGNVTAVSLLDTVGVPGSPAGPESGRGPNFAAVMQQAGDEAGTTLPASAGSGGSQEKGKAAEQGGGTGISHAARETAAAPVDASTMEATKKMAAAQLQAATRLIPGNVAGALGGAFVQNVTGLAPELTSGVLSKNAGGFSSVQTGTAELPAPAIAPDAMAGEAAAPIETTAMLHASATDSKESNRVLNVIDPGAASLPPTDVGKQGGKNTGSLDAKLTGKTVESKSDSKLTTLIAQGVVTLPQSDALSAVSNTAALVVPEAASPAGSPNTDIGA